MNVLLIDDHVDTLKYYVVVEELIKDIYPQANLEYAAKISTAKALMWGKPFALALIDLAFINDPKEDGFSLLRWIKDQKMETKTIALTGSRNYPTMNRALKAGFDSFLSKDFDKETFRDTIKGVMKRGRYENAHIKQLKKERRGRVVENFSDPRDGLTKLTQLELKTLICCAQFRTPKEVDEKMGVRDPRVGREQRKKIREALGGIEDFAEMRLIAKEFEDEIRKLLE